MGKGRSHKRFKGGIERKAKKKERPQTLAGSAKQTPFKKKDKKMKTQTKTIFATWTFYFDGSEIKIELRKDQDAYRWYQSGDGADTEVSGETIPEAIDVAWKSWRMDTEVEML